MAGAMADRFGERHSGMANARLTTFVRDPETPSRLVGTMLPAFINDRATLGDASDLIERYGDDAFGKAAALAAESRSAGNVKRFCHWRQIQRLIATLNSATVVGTIH